MKIGVLSEGEELTSYVSDDFGHAPYVLIVDYDTLDYEVVVNNFVNSEGAGMKMADALVSIGVDAVITGGIGSHGYEILTKAGIKVAYDEEGIVEECVEAFKRRREREA